MAINRRDFLKVTAGSGLLLAADVSPGLASPPKSLPPEAVGILYDATLCIGCKSCMVNCKKYNSMPGGALRQDNGSIPYEYQSSARIYDAPTDLSAKTLNIIKVYRSGTGVNKDQVENGYSFVQQHCLHCVDPACASVCPVGAFHKLPGSGIVAYEADKCIGCRYCELACPFGVPRFEWRNASPKLVKCQLCRHRVAEGGYSACCEFCPTGASLFGKVVDLRAEAARRLALPAGSSYDYPLNRIGSGRSMPKKVANYYQHTYGLTEAGGTQCMLLAGVPFDKLGFNPRITDQRYPDLTWEYIVKVPILIAALLAAGTVVQRLTRNKGDDR